MLLTLQANISFPLVTTQQIINNLSAHNRSYISELENRNRRHHGQSKPKNPAGMHDFTAKSTSRKNSLPLLSA